MHPKGKHLLMEYVGCDQTVLNDSTLLRGLLLNAAEAAHTRVVADVFRRFEPSGVTGVLVLEESHLSIHTWPEHGYAALDFYTCGDGQPVLAHEVMCAGLKVTRYECLTIHRGQQGEQLIHIADHSSKRSSEDGYSDHLWNGKDVVRIPATELAEYHPGRRTISATG